MWPFKKKKKEVGFLLILFILLTALFSGYGIIIIYVMLGGNPLWSVALGLWWAAGVGYLLGSIKKWD